MAEEHAHPLSLRYREMTEEEYTQLVEDIGANGLHEPIVMYEGMILDGRHRYRALHDLHERGVVAGVPEPPFVHFEGTYEEAEAYVRSLNLCRRHLTQTQMACQAVEWIDTAPEFQEERRGGDHSKVSTVDTLPGRSREIAAIKYGVSTGLVAEVEQVKRRSPAVYEEMKAGQIGLREAQRGVRLLARQEMTEMPLPTGKYRVIYADPPWFYSGQNLEQYGPAERHYPTMEEDALCAMPVADLADDEAVLFLWATSPKLPDALRIMNAWGFAYKTSFVWDKVKHNFGHYNSVRHEFLLIGTRGSCKPDTPKLHDSVLVIERAEHSRKPEEVRCMIDSMYTHGARIELFARGELPYPWEGWGDEHTS